MYNSFKYTNIKNLSNNEEIINSKNIEISYNKSNLYSDESKLIKTINRKNHDSGLSYNIIILYLSNINLIQFLIPYMIQLNGYLPVILTSIILIVIIYYLQKDIIKSLILLRNNQQCNYAKIVNKYLNSFFSTLLEILLLIYIIGSIVVCFVLSNKAIEVYSNYNFKSHNNKLILYIYTFLIVILYTYIFLIVSYNSKLSNLVPYICFIIQIMNLVVRFIFVILFYKIHNVA